MIEVLAIGTAFKRNPSVRTASAQLPPQAIIRDRGTFFSSDMADPAQSLRGASSGGGE
jgi:hypothetical protein